MNISVLTVFPELYEPFVRTSLIKLAQEKGIIDIGIDDFFSFVEPKKRIDSPTYGPGAGMLIKPEVVERAIDAKEKEHGKAFKIFFSPHGKKLDQSLLKQLAHKVKKSGHLMLIPARYEGMDARVEQEYADEVISVGDFVLMGGDIPAMMLLEGLLRLIPGVVGKQESVEQDSFSGPFVDYPEYTEPVVWKGKEVPDIVRSGNHGAIETWRKQQAVKRTVKDHFTWLRSQKLSSDDKKLAQEYVPPHYIALMHGDVVVGKKEKRVGPTSVTTIDIHDIARSACTYGLKRYFVVTPLLDQQKIVKKLLDFWKTGYGTEYNVNRHQAVRQVDIASNLDEVIEAIEKQEGKRPILVATSAQKTEQGKVITYFDQSIVWKHDRPVLFLFGTGQGLSQALIDRCDYILVPIEGLSHFNHLSVRAAASIVLDRWLGINLKKA